jgi:hypothetical protein
VARQPGFVDYRTVRVNTEQTDRALNGHIRCLDTPADLVDPNLIHCGLAARGFLQFRTVFRWLLTGNGFGDRLKQVGAEYVSIGGPRRPAGDLKVLDVIGECNQAGGWGVCAREKAMTALRPLGPVA